MFYRYICILVCFPASTALSGEASPSEVFEKRILPIFKSPNPSSCVECHLSGVDLKDYLLPDAEKTFRSLRDQGLIDLDKPENSKIIRLIEMGTTKNGPATVHAKNREREREAFLNWIQVCAADPKLRDAPKLDTNTLARPELPNEVIRHARKDRLLESFERQVWAWRFRCMNCHTEGTPQNDKLRKDHGDRVAWVKKAGPEATMEYLIASKLIDPTKPEQSLLLRKPLGEKEHAGGVKFVVGDDAYKGFHAWIEDVAAIRGNQYRTGEKLPTEDRSVTRFGTDIWFKLTDCPPDWGDQFLQVRLYLWDAKAKAWESSPIAVSDRLVNAKMKLWQHNLTLSTATESTRSKSWRTGKPALPDGKYLAKIYVDREGKLTKDWKSNLSETEFVGQIEFQARWREGYGGMTGVSARGLKRPERK